MSGNANKRKKTKTIEAKQPGIYSLPWYWLMLGAIVLTFATFYQSGLNSFINWDDNNYIYENYHLSEPLSIAVPYYFHLNYFLGSYTPVTMTAFNLIAMFGGINPAGFHHASIFLHLVVVGLVFWLAYLLSNKKKWVALIVATFFGVHPMHAESVLWAAELKDVLYSVFFFGGLITYYMYVDDLKAQQPASVSRSKMLYLITLLLFILGMLSKPAIVAFPIIMLLLDYYVRRPYSSRVVLEKIPFFILSIIIGVITLKGLDTYNLMANPLPLGTRLLCASYAYMMYFLKLLVPAGLCIFYPYPDMPGGHLPTAYYLPPLVVAVVMFVAFKTYKKFRELTFGIVFFTITIFLTLQIISAGMSILADHYTYVPYFGLLFAFAMFIDRYAVKLPMKKELSINIVGGVLIALALLCCYLTYSYVPVWQSADTICDDMLLKYPNNCIALNDKGFCLHNEKNDAAAIPYYEKAIKMKNDYAFARVNLINSLVAQQQVAEAGSVADESIKVLPDNSETWVSRGFVYLCQKMYDSAIAPYEKAVELGLQNRNAYLGLAECYYKKGQFEEEIKVLDKGLKHLPGNTVIMNYKGFALYKLQRYNEAIVIFDQCIKLSPDYEAAKKNREFCINAINGK